MTSGDESQLSETERPRKLYRVGGLTAAVYLLTCLFFIKGPDVYSRAGRELLTWFCVLSLLPLYWKGYRIVKASDDRRVARTIACFAALFCLLAIFTFPFHSTDVFGYINRGWQQVHYGQNPYIYAVGDIPQWQQDPMLWNHWIYNPNPYGFLFSLLARSVAYVGHGNWWLMLFLFKSVNALAYAVIAWLVWSGAKLSGHARPAVALYAFLWNPLVLMHHIANGHNDLLAGCLIALAFYLLLKDRCVWVVPVLVAATLMKYAPALLIPPALIFVFRRKGWKVAALGCLLGALVFVLVSAPYLQDWRLLRLEDIRDNATLIDNSLHSLLIHIYENAARLVPALDQFHGAVDALIKNTLRFGLLVFFVFQVYRARKDSSAYSLLERCTLILFVLICVASSKFNAWYLGMLLPPALLLEERHWLRRLIILISCTELLSLTFFKQAYMINYFGLIVVPAWIIRRQVRKEKASGVEPGEGVRSTPILPASQGL
ncbi:MAG: hypothetical protein LC754_17725 [Acidobacteria bacterium]|nr:hypothetical protein [Acidobacteriota bacterium]